MATFDAASSQLLANKLRTLHLPGEPLVLTNIWDPPSASLALKFKKTKALATASYAVASVCSSVAIGVMSKAKKYPF